VKVLVDVNLSPAWTGLLAEHHIEAAHWTSVGDPRAADSELMRYAREHGYVVFTHDLDFGTLLALTGARGPSVVQVRAQKASRRRGCRAPTLRSWARRFRPREW
jgi:predicted nuclease of predicted toxin-antitoxin system